MKNRLKNKIVHIIIMDKFIPPFIDFIDEHFDIQQHIFIILGKEKYKFGLRKEHNVFWIDTPIKLLTLSLNLHNAKKVIMHGLWSKIFNIILYMQPSVLKRTYWVMWGADLYERENQNFIDRFVRKNIGHIVTYIEGDYELAKSFYGTQGKYHECFMYPSNLYKSYSIKIEKHNTINIQLGNSADSSNNHMELLKKLERYKNEDIKIFTPLSYGDKKYAKEVIELGNKIFGNKFVAITEFMTFNKYLEFLGDIDIAIFAHKRQQAMGNIITLLGLGKKVYIRRDITTWFFFKEIGVKVFDTENINLELYDNDDKYANKKKIKEYFSEENYLKQLKHLFKD